MVSSGIAALERIFGESSPFTLERLLCFESSALHLYNQARMTTSASVVNYLRVFTDWQRQNGVSLNARHTTPAPHMILGEL